MKYLLFLFLLVLPPFSSAETDSMSEILKIAAKQLNTKRLIVKRTSANFCIVQRENKEGFVIVAKHGNIPKRIIGYSEGCAWDEQNLPPVLLKWMDRLESTDISDAAIDSIAPIQRNHSVPPLLTCHWHQQSPYNDLAPVIMDGNVKTAAGCVAIAAAQIAYYWRKDNPSNTLRDTPIYPYGAAPVTLSIPKGTPNKWDLMQDRYTTDDSPESRYAAAQLCYVLGTTSYLNYASSTGGSINDASNALYSQYNLISEYTTRNKHNLKEWKELLYNDIERGYPVLCAGNDGDGHAFVLDGFNHENDLYHFNFGWGGAGDGYYPIDDSELSMGGYYKNQSVVYNILPKNRNIAATLNCIAVNDTTTLINAVSEICNNSTLPIKQLCLYNVPQDSSIEKTKDPIWTGNEIANDGHKYVIQISFSRPSTEHNTLFLTDQDKNILTQCHFDISNGIGNNRTIPEKNQIYNLHGQETKEIKHGIYIINGNRVIIK